MQPWQSKKNECRHSVDERKNVVTIDVLGTGNMIVLTLGVEKIGGSRLLESEVDVIYSITIFL